MKDFLRYYQDELLFLRKKGGNFAQKHPEIAEKLDIKDGASADPHTERIIESVAFMAAELSQKIDDNAQNIAFHLLSALYPNLINTFPPCSIVRFDNAYNVSTLNNITINKGTSLYVKSKTGMECQFRTLYPITLYPISLTEINTLKAAKKLGGDDGWCIEIKIKTNSVPIEQMGIDDLLFYINSDIIENALMIYEAIFSEPNRSVFVKVTEHYAPVVPQNLVPCGFDADSSICPVPPFSTNCLQLFQEVLHFKRKFMFFKLKNVGQLINTLGIQNIDEFSIIIDIKVIDMRTLQIIKSNSIILNATPIVNLFPVTSDPFRFDGTQSKYLLLADQARDESLEIQSVSELHIINNETKNDEIVQPYFSLKIDMDTNIIHDLYWVHSKESSELRHLEGFDTYISFVDTKMNPYDIYADVVYAKTLCTNRFATRDIPVLSRLYIDNVETAGYHAILLHKTSEPISFLEGSTALWNLISQLCSSHLSIFKSENLLISVHKLFDIFSAGNTIKVDELLNGIKDIDVYDTVQRFGHDAWRGFVKGKEVTLKISEEDTFFSYLCGAIINQYLSDIISINSFIKLQLKSIASGKTLASWRITSGRQDVL